MHQHDIDHRALVNDQQVAVEGVLLVALEPERLGVELQEAMDGLGLHSRCLGHALGGSPRRGAQEEIDGLGRQDTQYGIDDGRLADSGPSRSAGSGLFAGRGGTSVKRLDLAEFLSQAVFGLHGDDQCKEDRGSSMPASICRRARAQDITASWISASMIFVSSLTCLNVVSS